MDKKGIKTELPFLHLKQTTKYKPKPMTDRKSRNISSIHGINDVKLKELLITYMQTQPSQPIANTTRNTFGSFDKATHVTSYLDNSGQYHVKYKKIYPSQQIKVRNNKLKVNINSNSNNNNGNSISNYLNSKKTQVRLKRNMNMNNMNANHVKAESMFDFVNVLKPELSQRSRETNTVMNIVNNLNGDTLSQTSRGNKNVEINFNKYEIRLFSSNNKKESNESKEIAEIKECVSKQIKNQKQQDKESLSSKVVIVDAREKDTIENNFVAKTVSQGIEDNSDNKHNDMLLSKKKSNADRETYNDNEDNNTILCPNQPKKMTQLMYRNNSIIKPNKKVVLSQSNEKTEIKDNNNNCSNNNNNITNANNNNKDNDIKEALSNDIAVNNYKNTITNDKLIANSFLSIQTTSQPQPQQQLPQPQSKPQFTCSMSIANENTLTFQGKEPGNILSIPSTQKQLKLSIKTDTDQETKNDHHIKLSFVPKLKLNANYNIFRSPSKRSKGGGGGEDDNNSIEGYNGNSNRLSFPRKEPSKFCRTKRKDSNTDSDKTPPFHHTKILDSSDISIDEEENNFLLSKPNHTESTNSKFILNNLQIQTLKKNLNTQDHTSTEATNTNNNNNTNTNNNNLSIKNSSDKLKVKDNSAYSFLLKRTPTNFLASRNNNLVLNLISNNTNNANSNANTPNNKNNNNSPIIQPKLKFALSPKKNKRFLRQLSKISELSNKKNKKPKKDKLTKSSSLPLISIEKISNILEVKKPSRQLTTLHLVHRKKLLELSHHNSFEINQKNVIEEEQLSEMPHSKESSSSSSIVNRTRSDIKKKPSIMSNSTGGINFFEMRASSIQIATNISKCFTQDNRVYCQSFIEKYIDEIKQAQSDCDLYATDAKNDLLHKTILSIDLQCERLEDKRRTTYTQFANDTILHLRQSVLNVNDFLSSDDHKNQIKEEVNDNDNDYECQTIVIEENDSIDEHEYNADILNYYCLYLPSILSFPFIDKYYEINILYSIEKENYLQCDHIEEEMSIIANFSKVIKGNKKLISAMSIRKCKSLRKSVTFKELKIQKTRALVINPYEYFKFIQMDDVPIEDKTDRINNNIIIPIEKISSSTPKKTYKRNESKLNPKRKISTLFRKNSTRLSLSSKKSIEETSMLFSSINNRKDSVLQKRFYSRIRDSINNYDYDKDPNTSFFNRRESILKKREELYKSPLKYRGKIRDNTKHNTIVVKDFLHFNKESVMFKTYEIKTKLLTEMGNYIDTMFFYIKDSNFQNFKDMFLKYKVSPEVQDKDGNSFLNVAVQSGSDKIVLFLLNNSSNVNTQNKLLNSPLHYALSYKNFTLADVLIKFGADESLKNRHGNTPWECLNTKNSII